MDVSFENTPNNPIPAWEDEIGCADTMPTAYEQKFADFLRMCDQAKKGKLDVVVVHDPETLGDDYVEIVESLNRLADAKLKLAVLPRAERGK